eukprot:TRINITY_DN14147_c0_g1_i2.p4 TRINITY_DN14147_c0_g1~~TRINITY_DN14147_c0_g1_i2.p4  ORF type:complete len:115 (-),score=21.18 TRINITY_DN14147_c0_g1_i2:575-919(-)
MNLFRLLGKIIGKALFERISLNCYLDQTILCNMLKIPIELKHIESFDQALYQSWKFILETPLDQEGGLDEYFVIYQEIKEGQIFPVELKENGSTIQLNDSNKKEFVDLNIQYYA